MKFFVPFVAGFAAIAAAAPVADNTVSVQSWMADLTSQAKGFTGAMNKTLASLGSNPSDEDKKRAAAEVIPQIQGLTALMKEASSKVNTAIPEQEPTGTVSARASKPSQPTLADLPKDVLGQLNGQPIVLAKLLLPLLQELNPALQSVLVTLSLGEVYVALQPLLRVELPALVTALGNLVNGLLVALAPLLAGLGGILGPLLLGLGL